VAVEATRSVGDVDLGAENNVVPSSSTVLVKLKDVSSSSVDAR
jgi:hypothetical protein